MHGECSANSILHSELSPALVRKIRTNLKTLFSKPRPGAILVIYRKLTATKF